ncbi:MAG: SDR family NAD(P)-dependent oxidoreductase, partial [Opitutaceae bacterium]
GGAPTPAELADRLRELAAGREVPGAWRGGARPDRADAVIQRGLAAATVAGLSSRAVDPVAYREALELLAALYVKGAEIDWFALHAGEAPRRIPLPLYPFARERYWFAAAPAAVRAAPDAAPDPAGRVLRGDEPFLRDHRVGGVPVVPGVAYLGWLRAAAGAGAALRQVAWLRPLGVPAPLEVRVVERAGPAGTRRLVVVRPDGTEHAEATVAAAAPAPGGILPHAECRARWPEELPGDASRARCAAAGLEWGPTMAALRTVWAGADEVLAYLVRPAGATDDGWDPALLDGALQATAALGEGAGGGGPVPFALEAVTREALPAEVGAHVVRRPAAGGLRRFDVRFATTEGRVLGTLEGLAMRPLRAGPPDAAPAVSAAAVAAEAVAPVDAPAAFLAWLTERFAEQVKLPPARLRPDDALEKFGLDSLMVTDFTRRLEESFGELPKTLLFEHQTLGELAAHLRTAHPGRVAALIAPAPGRALPRAIGAPTVVAAPVPGPAVPAPVGRADDIAIIGVAGRYPDAPDLDAFWRNLRAGRDSIIEIPPDRWDHRVFHDPRPGQPGKTRNKWGGFLPDVARFDAAFFGVTPREAIALDPQERIFLETAWQTLESAGYSRPALARRPVGVFVGVMYGEYQLHGAGDPATGGVLPLSSSYASIANRVSYFFNWHGPSLAVDTMCSSSLAAIHLACAALQRGEAELALAGGVNVTVHPHKDMLLAPGGFAAGDGRCRSFGAGGDGYVPGEGVGAVLLKPLAQAVADGDHIWGVIRASALNHGGKTNGYTVPNPKAQADVVGAALRRGGVAPDAVSYVEAHGTGTALGDPIEVAALARAFGDEAGAPEGHACLLGSVKSNIGHLEGAAGVAGLTKVLLQLRHAEIAPSLHSRALNPNIPFERTRFRVPQAVTAWPAGVAPRTAGVSSFGAGGANAHLIVSEAPPRDPAPAAAGPALIVLSARTADRLRAVAARLAAWLAEAAPADLRLTDVAFTLAAGREALDERLALFAADLADLRAQLAPFAAGGELPASGWRGRRREEPESPPPADAAPETIAAAWVSGTEIDWAGCLGSGDGRRIPLPGYPFAGERFWAPDRITRAADAPSAPPPPTASGLLLAPRWQPLVEAGDAAGPTPAGRGLVFDADPRLAAELARLFPQVSFTRVAPAGAAPAPGVVALGAEDEAGYAALVAAGPPALVVPHWATVSAGEPDPTSGLLSLVRLVRAVLRRSPAARLNVVFCHPPGCPEHEGVGGWARSLIREHPGIVVSLLEAPAPSVAAVARRLADRAPRQVRLTAAGAEELGLAELTPPAGTVLVRGGVYLITGGAGGLGRLLAPHLAARWGARIVLAGRSVRGPEQEALVAAVRAAGGDARYVAADVATAAGAAAAVAAAREAFGRLDGVFHAAGVLRDRALRMKPPADYVAVAAPKL